ncbi:pyridine nucleotide-disulfide oxidoreductase-domain-containing protein [Cladochytrium replicatum]|nr:pyridine nucleotide-disulfide oxidoreductase-domain-containing protein [Cladochytrium replicatum]
MLPFAGLRSAVGRKLPAGCMRSLGRSNALRPTQLRLYSEEAGTNAEATIQRTRRIPRLGYAAAFTVALTGATATYVANTLRSELDAEIAPLQPLISPDGHTITIDGVPLPVVKSFGGQDPGDANRPRLVILGSGWGATSLLKTIDPANYSTIVISPSNAFLFTPLLPESTTGTVESRSLLESMRKICQRSRATYWEAEAYDVYPDLQMVAVKTAAGDRFLVPYDKLVIGVGAQNATFGVPGVKENANFLKTSHDARSIRYKLLELFETAALPTVSVEQKKQMLSFVCAGGGPTSIEFATGLHDFIAEDASKWFPDLIPYVKVSVIQSGEHILNAFAEAISTFAEDKFKRQNIDVITNARVVKVEKNNITFRLKGAKPGENDLVELPFGLCVWSTGIEMRDITKRIATRLGLQNKRALEVDPHLRILGGNIYAIGDCATIESPKMQDMFMSRLRAKGSNRLSLEEFSEVCASIVNKYPQARVHLRKARETFDEYDRDQSGFLEIGEIETLLKDIGKKLTSLPATAQVANQQGAYLGGKLNKLGEHNPSEWMAHEDKLRPFNYNHLGSFSYIGSDSAVYDYGNMGQGGWLVFLAWRGAYLSRQVSFRTRVLLAFDWFVKRYFLGRDISRV